MINVSYGPGTASRSIGAPRDWDAATMGKCGALEVVDLPGEHGSNYMVSAWRMEAGDLGLILAGAPIHLAVMGRVHPVVSLYAGEPAAGHPGLLQLAREFCAQQAVADGAMMTAELYRSGAWDATGLMPTALAAMSWLLDQKDCGK